MVATVQLFPGGTVRAYRSIATKPAATTPITKDDTLIVGRRPPGLMRADYTIADKDANTTVGAPRDGTLIVGRRPPGLMRAAYTIVDKDEAVDRAVFASDTYLVYQSLGSLEEVVVYTTDTARPLAALYGSTTTAVASSDTYIPRATFASSPPLGSGAVPVISEGDTYRPVAALATVHASVLIQGTDSYVPVATDDSGTGPEKVDLVAGSDTMTPVLRWGWRVIVHTYVTKTTTESYVPRLTLAPATVTKRNAEIDNIDVTYRPIWNFKVTKS